MLSATLRDRARVSIITPTVPTVQQAAVQAATFVRDLSAQTVAVNVWAEI